MKRQLCAFEGYFVSAKLPVHWVDRFWRRVNEIAVFKAEKARLTRPGPELVPTSIQRMKDSVGFNCIRANVGEHRIEERDLLRVGRRT